MAIKQGTKKKKKVDIIDMNNQPINPQVQKEEVSIPTKFVSGKKEMPKIAESKIKLHNGRVYKELGNGYCMYADNGEVFRK